MLRLPTVRPILIRIPVLFIHPLVLWDKHKEGIFMQPEVKPAFTEWGMTDRTYQSLTAKAEHLGMLMDARTVDFGHDDATPGYFVEIMSKPGDSLKNYRGEFKTVQALHRYFNEKIELFSGGR